MKRKNNKGKIFPSPSPPFSSPPHQDGHFLSVLNQIPTAILALLAVLSLEDREVLAYMITRSLQTPTGCSATAIATSTKTIPSSKSTTANGGSTHRPPLFHCECFDCYTAYWLRWDSSPNRELIHQAIEAFEEHLITSEQLMKNNIRGSKRREKGSQGKGQPRSAEPAPEMPLVVELSITEEPVMVVVDEEIMQPPEEDGVMVERVEETLEDGDLAAAGRGNDHKGLARKVLPDVMGLLNSRLWKLWNPSM